MDASWAELQRHLLMRYAIFKKRLTRYLGSADLASDALHDTWLRLERGGAISTVRNPDTYLFSMAVNIASNRRRAESRRLTSSEVEALFEVADDQPDAERVAEARSELEVIVTAIGELSERQRAVLLAARIEGTSRRDLARRFDVSERYIQRELQVAHEHCAARIEASSNMRVASSERDREGGKRHVKAAAAPTAPEPDDK